VHRKDWFATSVVWAVAVAFAIVNACAHGLHVCERRCACSHHAAHSTHPRASDASRSVDASSPSMHPGACPACILLSEAQGMPVCVATVVSRGRVCTTHPRPRGVVRAVRGELPALAHAPPSHA
jgi:hypothetical protein